MLKSPFFTEDNTSPFSESFVNPVKLEAGVCRSLLPGSSWRTFAGDMFAGDELLSTGSKVKRVWRLRRALRSRLEGIVAEPYLITGGGDLSDGEGGAC
jgi:hypothetical protein